MGFNSGFKGLRLSKLVKGTVLETLFCTSVNNLCTIKLFEKKTTTKVSITTSTYQYYIIPWKNSQAVITLFMGGKHILTSFTPDTSTFFLQTCSKKSLTSDSCELSLRADLRFKNICFLPKDQSLV